MTKTGRANLTSWTCSPFGERSTTPLRAEVLTNETRIVKRVNTGAAVSIISKSTLTSVFTSSNNQAIQHCANYLHRWTNAGLEEVECIHGTQPAGGKPCHWLWWKVTDPVCLGEIGWNTSDWTGKRLESSLVRAKPYSGCTLFWRSMASVQGWTRNYSSIPCKLAWPKLSSSLAQCLSPPKNYNPLIRS